MAIQKTDDLKPKPLRSLHGKECEKNFIPAIYRYVGREKNPKNKPEYFPIGTLVIVEGELKIKTTGKGRRYELHYLVGDLYIMSCLLKPAYIKDAISFYRKIKIANLENL